MNPPSSSTKMAETLPELPSAYAPAEAEASVTVKWDESGVSHAPSTAPNPDDTFSIVIPPPNVTAALHLGHGLNNTLQDVLTRYHRMRGSSTLWMPGTDHAGIATQTVVEKRLLAQGIKRLDMGRDAFVATTQEWKDEYEAVILDQLKSLGASCDWDRVRFTMDEVCSVAVRHAFYLLFRDGLIYRGKRLVNWDPVTRTALADDEVESEEIHGHMWYLNYPLVDGSGVVTVATTRPETMLGDTAVAVNPSDPRAEELVGKMVRLPIVGREIPIIADDYVVLPDPESSDNKAKYASGFLKVTPAHDPNDWEIGLRHDLPAINVMGPDGTMSADYGWDDVSEDVLPFVGLSREDARVAIVEWFEANGLLDKVVPYHHAVGHSYRSHVPIEPWLSDQWFVRVTDDRLRGSAMRALTADQAETLPEGIAARGGVAGDGEMRFYPDRYAKTYMGWHENIRDWCISRQLWWGHQIPVWTRLVSADSVARHLDGVGIDEPVQIESTWSEAGAVHVLRKITDFEVEDAICVPPAATLSRATGADEGELVARLEADGYVRDADVLDTWFSSALWPLSTMGWPWPEDFPDMVGLLDSYNPTSLLTTAREIITLWVSRMVMFNRYFLDGKVPFEDVFIHAMIQDGHGQKMSKSLGNGVDPRDIIKSHGADAMRFTFVHMTTDTQDVRMPVDMVCPHTGETFTPEYVQTSAGHMVAAPVQTSPSDPNKKMVSAYGVSSGEVAATEDMPLATNTSAKFDLGRNFANKVWNATRFAVSRLQDRPGAAEAVDASSLRFVDRWILTRFAQAAASIESHLDSYAFNATAEALYDFIWRDLCDVYLEAVKPTIDDDPAQQVTLAAMLDGSLRLLHPVCPFVTEALWEHVSSVRSGEITGVSLPESPLLAGADWPRMDDAATDVDTLALFGRADGLITAIRTVRAQRQVKPKQRIVMHVPTAIAELLAATDGLVETLAGVGEVVPMGDERPVGAIPLAFEGAEVLLSGLVDEVDVDAERARLTKQIDGLRGQIKGFEGKLNNPGYVNGAPPEMVAETRDRLASAQADLAAAEAALAALG